MAILDTLRKYSELLGVLIVILLFWLYIRWTDPLRILKEKPDLQWKYIFFALPLYRIVVKIKLATISQLTTFLQNLNHILKNNKNN